MRSPNFFIVGAPKCGTTAMHEYLQTHPSIYMSLIKEPKFFASDTPNVRFSKSLEQYLSLFKDASEEHAIIGESSALYLFSPTALKAISEFNKDSSILVMLRNPIDLVYSFHSELLYQCIEDETDFEKAWELQEVRRQGFCIPASCREESYLQYREIGKLGTQVEALLHIFPDSQVKFVLFEDFTERTKVVYEETLDFLGLTSDGREKFPKVRSGKGFKHRWVASAMQLIPKIYAHTPLAKVMKQPSMASLRIKLTQSWHNIRRLNSTPNKREPLRDPFKDRLKEEFGSEVIKLSKLISRDLSHWLN